MTFPIERVLVGLDSEGHAHWALERGVDLATRLNAGLIAVHAVPLDAHIAFGGSAAQLDAAHAQTLSAARSHVEANIRPVLRSVDAEDRLPQLLAIHAGHPAAVLEERSEQADLLLLGAHRKHGLFDLGGTARHVLAHISRPVWLQPCEPQPVKRITVATDFSEHGGCALAYARELASRLGAALRVVHCFTPPSFAYAHDGGASLEPYAIAGLRDGSRAELEQLMEATDWGELEVSSEMLEGPPLDAILTAAEQADLLVLGTHGRSGLSRFVMGSVSQGVLKRHGGAVLVVPNRAASWILSAPAD